MRQSRLVLIGGLLVAAALLILHARLFWRYTVDDAFISFRYAKNLTEGHGLVYNPGERVEGYSNLAWTLLFALLSLISAEPVGLAKAVGVALGVGALPLVLLLGLEASGSALVAALCVLLVAINPFVAVWLVAGLETPLFLLGLAALAYASARELKALYFAAGALVCLSRPEGAALVAVLAGWGSFGERPVRFRPWLVLPLLAAAGQLGFRLWTYGQWVPNTALIKTGGGWPQYRQGLVYLFELFDDWSCQLGLLALCLAPFLLGDRKALRTSLVLVLGYLGFLVYSGGDYFALYRLAVPILPLLTVVLVATLAEAGRRLELSRAAQALAAGALVLCLALAPLLKSEAGRQRLIQEIQMMDGFLRPAAYWLRDHSPPGTTIALTVAGAIPYYSGLRAIDRLGLCDAEIARAQIPWDDRHYGIAKYDSDSVLRRRPEWILLNLDEATVLRAASPQELAQRAYVPADRDLLSRPRFHQEYRLVRGWLREAPQQFALYARRGGAVDPGP
jgi:hypothetical protein